MTESLALALCMQLADDMSYLATKFGVKTSISIDNYTKIKENPGYLVQNRSATLLFNSIVRNYSIYANFLTSRIYNGKEEDKS